MLNDNTPDVPAVSSPASSVTSESLTENAVVSAPAAEDVVTSPSEEVASPEKTFADTVEKLESGSSPKEAIEKPKPSSEAPKDERAKDNGKDALSQLSPEQEQALTKTFAERPEWRRVLDITPKEKQKEMRGALRTLYERETSLHQQIEKQKPVLQTFERFRKGVGDDQAVENTIQLVEMFSQGNPKAREMLVTLLNDLDARTGAVLTSQDLMQRNRSIDDRLQQGTIDENEAKQLRNDLLEIEKSRVTAKRSEAEVQQRDKREQQTTVEAQMQATEDAGTEWEKSKMGSDPDYPALKDTVEKVAKAMLLDHPSFKSGKVLTPSEAVKILNDSLAWAKSQVSQWQPKPKPRNGLNGHGSSSSATSRRQPANAEESFYQKIEELEARRGR